MEQDPEDTLSTLAARAGAALIARGEAVAVAESSAGGLISATLLAVPGASGFFAGGAVVYDRRARVALLGMTDAAAAGMRPSTEPYAGMLAGLARERLGAAWGIGETGAAGPTANRYGDPAGHACVAVRGPGVAAAMTVRTGRAGRADNMRAFTQAALHLLNRHLLTRHQAAR